MTEIIPPPPPPQRLAPSNSTTASAASGAAAAVLFWILSLKGITAPAGIEAAIAVLISTLIGYLPRSGRQ